MVSDASSQLKLQTDSSSLFTEKSPNMECSASQCCCPHTNSHFLVRCGCPNDKPSSHPMHTMDDAFHREWCTVCLRFCHQPPQCRYVCLPGHKRVLHGPLLYVAAIFQYLTREYL